MENSKKLHSVALASAIAILILVVISSAATAKEIKVGPKEQYTSIQSAVDNAKPEDTILVASGNYRETVNLDKTIEIKGSKHTIVEGIYIHHGHGVIDNLNINKYGIKLDGGIGTTATIRNNVIANCKYGILIDSGVRIPAVTGNTFRNCDIGIYFNGFNNPDLSLIKNNKYINCKVQYQVINI